MLQQARTLQKCLSLLGQKARFVYLTSGTTVHMDCLQNARPLDHLVRDRRRKAVAKGPVEPARRELSDLLRLGSPKSNRHRHPRCSDAGSHPSRPRSRASHAMGSTHKQPTDYLRPIYHPLVGLGAVDLGASLGQSDSDDGATDRMADRGSRLACLGCHRSHPSVSNIVGSSALRPINGFCWPQPLIGTERQACLVLIGQDTAV